MRTKDHKIELFSYMMVLGEMTSAIEDRERFIGMCIMLNNARKELIKQYKNLQIGEGTVNGKWYQNTKEPFQNKIKRVKANMRKLVKNNYPWIKIAFEAEEVFLILGVDGEVDISKF